MMSPAPEVQDLLSDFDLLSAPSLGDAREALASSSYAKLQAPSQPRSRRPPNLITEEFRRERCHGQIKSFNIQKGYGFITSQKVKDFFGIADVFFSKTELYDLNEDELSTVQPGLPTSFWCHVNKDSKPQARVVRLESKSCTAPTPAAVKTNHDADEAISYSGVIKSFNSDQGYGFIECEQTMQRFKRDVFLHKNQLQNCKVGDKVIFTIKVNVDKQGRPQPKALTLQALQLGSDGQDTVSSSQDKEATPSTSAETHQAESEESELKPSLLPTSHAQEATSSTSAGSEESESKPSLLPTSHAQESESKPSLPTSHAQEATSSTLAETHKAESEESESKPSLPISLAQAEPDSEEDESFVEAEGGWCKYVDEGGDGQCWYWCERDEAWFSELDSGVWVRYRDPGTEKAYWWNPNGRWFWDLPS